MVRPDDTPASRDRAAGLAPGTLDAELAAAAEAGRQVLDRHAGVLQAAAAACGGLGWTRGWWWLARHEAPGADRPGGDAKEAP